MTLRLKTLDLFCGAGGFSQGLSKVPEIEIVAGIDFWDRAIETYSQNQNHIGLCKDLTEFSPEDFSELTGIKKIDLIIAAPPCQSFSIAGTRKLDDPRNSLFMEFVKYIEYFKPKAFMMENVVGILSKKTADNELVVDLIMQELTKYYNVKYFKLLASDFGVAQNRKRVIFFGFLKELKVDITCPISILSKDNHIAVETILEKKKDIDIKQFLSEKAILGIKNRKIAMEKKNFGFGAQFLDLKKPSYTISCRYWKDGSDALVKYSETEIRRLTLTELKRIQTFPDNYDFAGSKKETTIQIGNAVACKFAYHLGLYIAEKLEMQN